MITESLIVEKKSYKLKIETRKENHMVCKIPRLKTSQIGKRLREKNSKYWAGNWEISFTKID